ncbi:M20 family metallopeptidase [Conexibacter arvalis]|uniref:Succinyl-diaminopimelate desuccinylase n=1 Tax=Conexibacter arvalis TaxID=912552 RepID=A0A840II45_9ACTN|nr:M20/M25/M40 family metallo-hydrolase [Conexibacter arvalis]MBB4664449.1 succinyl-diaminopimelate desuccinylase [Conexibacter arvalis]
MGAHRSLDGLALTALLRQLVAVESTNPGTQEAAMADAVEAQLRGVEGIALARVETLPERDSLAAVVAGTAAGAFAGPRVILNGHLDTVPVDDPAGWSVPPFAGELRDGHVYGRGACDMKAGLAVQIALLRRAAARRERMRGTLIGHFAVGEECGEPGTRSLLEAGFGGDVGVVLEPTSCRVATAARGLCHLRVRIAGRSVHASTAGAGDNPIWRLPAVLEAVAAHRAALAERGHPLLPAPSCEPTVVRAGVKANAVADALELTLDRRLLPGETPAGALEELRAHLAAAGAGDPGWAVEAQLLPGAFPPAEIAVDAPFAARLRAAAATVRAEPGPQPPAYGTPFASDVGHLVEAGIEAVTFGPGRIEHCHCADERVPVADLLDTAVALSRALDETFDRG